MDEAAVRALFEDLEDGRTDAFFARVADDVRWTIQGTHPLAGVYHDKRTFRAHTFDRLNRLVQGGMRLRVTHVIAHGDEAVVELESVARTNNGKAFDNRLCWVMRFADNRIVEVRSYLDSALIREIIDENEKPLGAGPQVTAFPGPRVAVIGLGHMGRAIAERLQARGFALSVWNRSKEKARGLRVAVRESPIEAVKDAEIVLTCLSDDRAARDVVFEGGVLRTLGARAVHVGMSTISYELGRELASAHAEAGRGYVAAPVVGRPDAAASGRLFVLAGGDEATRRRCEPLFEALALRTLEFEDAPSANLAKLVVNLMLSGTIELIGEAVALGEKGGIDPKRTVDLLSQTLFGSAAVESYGPRIARGEFEPAGFRVPLGLKDVDLALGAGAQLGVPLPSAGVVRDHLIAAMARGLERADWSALTTSTRREAGLA